MPNVTCTSGYHRDGNLGTLDSLLDEDAVYYFVECAVATHNDDISIATLDSRYSKLGCVVLMFSEHSLVADSIVA